jgi:hypothetical protein
MTTSVPRVEILSESKDWSKYQQSIRILSKSFGDTECVIRDGSPPNFILNAEQALEA